MNISCIVRRGWPIIKCPQCLTIILLIAIISSLSQVLKETECTYCPNKDRVIAVKIRRAVKKFPEMWYSTVMFGHMTTLT